jgi:hypothetical protein
MKNWLIGALVLIFGAAAYYYFAVYQASPVENEPAPAETEMLAGPDPEPVRPPAVEETAREPEARIEEAPQPEVEEIPLPMLMESDPMVLETLNGLIGEPAVIRYLVSDNIISRFVATIDTMGSRQIPGVVQVVQGPATGFRATADRQAETVIRNEEGDEIPQFIIDPANYERYTPFVELLEAVDTASLVETYRENYPLFQEAYRQMGYAEGEFSDRLLAIIDELLASPEAGDPVHLVKPEAFYLFTDPALESLPAGQKVMLRMGTDNAARVKARLRDIREAL